MSDFDITSKAAGPQVLSVALQPSGAQVASIGLPGPKGDITPELQALRSEVAENSEAAIDAAGAATSAANSSMDSAGSASTSADEAGAARDAAAASADLAADVVQYVLPSAVGNGTTDDRAAFVSAASFGRALMLKSGTYRIASNMTLAVPVIFQPGAIIKPDSGVVVILGAAQALAAAQQIFDLSAGGFAGARSLSFADRRAYGISTDKPQCPFTWTGTHPLPAMLYIGADGKAVMEAYDLAAFAPVTNANIYVSWATGTNSPGNGSIGSPYKTIAYAITQTDANASVTAATFYVDAASYQFRSAPNAANKSCIIRPYNGSRCMFISSDDHSAGWTLHSGNCYKVTRSGAKVVVDKANIDSKGDWQELTLAADLATCVSTPGSWYTDATTVYVHAFNSRSLIGDTNMFVLLQQGAGTVGAGKKIYMENCDIFGANSAITGAKAAIILAKGCTFKHQVLSDSMNTTGSESYLQDCTIARSERDGLSYNQSSDTLLNAAALELNVISRHHGLRANNGTDNASTGHAGTRVVRINGTYNNTRGPVVADVGNSRSWNLGCDTKESRATAAGSLGWRQRSNFYCQASHMWIEGGSSITVTEPTPASGTIAGNGLGSVYDLSPDNGYIYVRGLRYSRRIDLTNTVSPQEILAF